MMSSFWPRFDNPSVDKLRTKFPNTKFVARRIRQRQSCTFESSHSKLPRLFKRGVSMPPGVHWLQVIGKTFNWRAREIAATVDHDIGRILAKCRCINTKPTRSFTEWFAIASTRENTRRQRSFTLRGEEQRRYMGTLLVVSFLDVSHGFPALNHAAGE